MISNDIASGGSSSTRKSHQHLLRDAEKLRALVTPTITLPDFDFSGITSVTYLSNMVDYLVDIERITGNSATSEPFAEKREDSPFVVWLRQPGLLMEIIASWAERQLQRLHDHLETMQPSNGFEQGEREVLLVTGYARRGDLHKAVALLTGRTPKWPSAEQIGDVVDAATDGRDRLDALRMMVDGSTLENSEKNAFHQIVRSVDEAVGGVEGALKDMHDIAREAA